MPARAAPRRGGQGVSPWLSSRRKTEDRGLTPPARQINEYRLQAILRVTAARRGGRTGSRARPMTLRATSARSGASASSATLGAVDPAKTTAGNAARVAAMSSGEPERPVVEQAADHRAAAAHRREWTTPHSSPPAIPDGSTGRPSARREAPRPRASCGHTLPPRADRRARRQPRPERSTNPGRGPRSASASNRGRAAPPAGWSKGRKSPALTQPIGRRLPIRKKAGGPFSGQTS